jgi:hypothetical protein
MLATILGNMTRKKNVPEPSIVDAGLDLEIGRDDIPGGAVDLRYSPSTGPYLMPRALRDLPGPTAEVVGGLQDCVAQLHEAQERLGRLVPVARAEGLSWDSIGWCLGISGEAVRRRFSDG